MRSSSRANSSLLCPSAAASRRWIDSRAMAGAIGVGRRQRRVGQVEQDQPPLVGAGGKEQLAQFVGRRRRLPASGSASASAGSGALSGNQLLQQPLAHRGRRGRIAGDLVGDDGAGLGIDQIDQPERELGEVLLLLGRSAAASAHRDRSSPAAASAGYRRRRGWRVRPGHSDWEGSALRSWLPRNHGAQNAHLSEVSASSVSEPLTMRVLNRGTDRSAAGAEARAGVRGEGHGNHCAVSRRASSGRAAAAMSTPIPSRPA